MISDSTARILKHISQCEYGMPTNEAPEWVDYFALDDLKNQKLIDYQTIIPPGKESKYPNGLSVARITAFGRDALAEYQRADDEKRQHNAEREADNKQRILERREDRIHDWFIAAFSILAGSALTLFIEHIIIPNI